MQHCIFLQLGKESCFVLTATDLKIMVSPELTRRGKATVGMRNLMESPRMLWECKNGTGEAILPHMPSEMP